MNNLVHVREENKSMTLDFRLDRRRERGRKNERERGIDRQR